MYKFTSRALLVLLLSGIATTVASAQNGKSAPSTREARQYISKMAVVYQNMKSYSGSIKVFAQVTGQPKMPAIEAEVSVQKPHLAAIRFTEGTDSNFALYDGTNLFATSSRHEDQYIKQPTSKELGVMRVLSRSGLTGPGLTLLFTRPDTLETFVPPSTLSLGKETRVAGVPVVTVISKKQEGQNKLVFTYHISKNDHLLRQMTLVQTTGGQTVTMIETHTNIKINTKNPATTFIFKPLPGAKQVNNFTSSR